MSNKVDLTEFSLEPPKEGEEYWVLKSTRSDTYVMIQDSSNNKTHPAAFISEEMARQFMSEHKLNKKDFYPTISRGGRKPGS